MYNVKRIRKSESRFNEERGVREKKYLVEWEPTWEPESNLSCARKIRECERERERRTRMRSEFLWSESNQANVEEGASSRPQRKAAIAANQAIKIYNQAMTSSNNRGSNNNNNARSRSRSSAATDDNQLSFSREKANRKGTSSSASSVTTDSCDSWTRPLSPSLKDWGYVRRP